MNAVTADHFSKKPEQGVVLLGDDRDPVERVEEALQCLPPYDPSVHRMTDDKPPFLYWKIRDFAHAYRSGSTTPSAVAEHIIAGVEQWSNKKPPMPMLVYFNADDLRKQADASTKRFQQGNPISILDGIFIAIKDDIDCFPYPSKGATTFFDKIRPVEKDAVCVARLRKCGVVFIGKANMHELGLGVTGNNPNYGTARNPHSIDRYTGGSSSGPAALAYAQQQLEQMVESPLCVPNLVSPNSKNILESVKIGKYTEWFHDVSDRDISNTCEDALKLLCSSFGCQIEEIILPELEEMRTAHVVSIGTESFCDLKPHYKAGKRTAFTLDTRTSLALFGSFTSTDYVASQRIRRRIMYYHNEAFKKVDVIATPTTGITAPKIPESALKSGESDYVVSACLMRFVLAGNLLGLPAITVPVGHDKQGLPIGLQLIGRPWGEASLLRMASAIEVLCDDIMNN
uniref:Amidase domain-containing protein n=1 Tax=Leersia perrieri TaxID=77586 RepID=A0A0D9W1Q7_9ORYZ